MRVKTRNPVEIYHMASSNRYHKKRKGKWYVTDKLKCTPYRVELPQGHSSTFSLDKINCSKCLEAMAKEFELKATYCLTKAKALSKTHVKKEITDRKKFIAMNVRTVMRLADLERLPPPDPEIAERIRAGV